MQLEMSLICSVKSEYANEFTLTFELIPASLKFYP